MSYLSLSLQKKEQNNYFYFPNSSGMRDTLDKEKLFYTIKESIVKCTLVFSHWPPCPLQNNSRQNYEPLNLDLKMTRISIAPIATFINKQESGPTQYKEERMKQKKNLIALALKVW